MSSVRFGPSNVKCVRSPFTIGHCHRRTCARALHEQVRERAEPRDAVSRRNALVLPGFALLASSVVAPPAHALRTTLAPPPPGYLRHTDRLDGYSFFYPDQWVQVTTSGNDVFFRNPFRVDENLFVDVSSPSSSRYASVADLGDADKAAERLKAQYLEEFMSTRIGVRREASVVFAGNRTSSLDDKLYYDIAIRVKSFASRSQLAVSEQERQKTVVMEFDRVLLTTLGVANRRLYQLRLQTPLADFESDPDRLSPIMSSFQCRDLEV